MPAPIPSSLRTLREEQPDACMEKFKQIVRGDLKKLSNVSELKQQYSILLVGETT